MAEDIEEPQVSEDPFAKYGGKAIEKSEDPFAKYGGKSIGTQSKTEQQVQPIQNAIDINQPTPIIQNVPKETSPYLKGLDFKTITDAIKADKSQQEQQNSTIGALYNSVVGGLGEAATGFLNRAAQSVPSSMGSVGGAPSGTMAGTTEDRAMAAKGIALATSDLIDKARTNASSRENEQSFNFDTNKGIIHNAKSLAFQLPRLAVDLGLGALTGGGSFFAQGEGAALEELKNNPEADKLTPNTQAGYVTTVGIVNGVLMKLGFDKIFKATGLEDLAAKRIINEVTSDLVKKGVKATTKDIEDAALRKAISFMTKANNVGIGALKSTLTGGGIGVVQAASDDAIKLLVDKASGVDVFNSEDIKENFPKHLLTSVIQGGATGLVMGLGHGMFENTNKAIRLKMAEAKTPQDIENIKQNINQQVESGNITPEQAQAANIKIQDYAQIAAKIPEEITSDRKYAIIGGIEQREGIKNEIQSTQDELNSTDEAFQSDKNAKLELLNAKLLQTNDYIDGLVTGEKTKYSEENGVYYKTDANGDKIPISKQHYELGSAAEKNDKKQTTQVQQPTETQKPTIETIGEVKPTTEKTETKELADKDLIPAYNKAEGFIIGDEARKSVGDVIGKINNAEYINENELDNASNHLYDLLDKHGDNKSFANLIEPLIHKIESYDFRTKSETSTVTERQATQVARPTREKTIANKSLEQWEGSNATITDEAGKTTKGKIKSENGKYYLYDNEGNKIHSIGEKALTDKHISIPSLEDVPNPVVFNENGTATVTLQLNKIDTERGGVYPNKKIKIEFNNPDKALDLAVQLRAEQIGEIPQPEFDTVYDEVQKEVTKEVPVKNLSKEKTAQKEVAPKVETKVTPTKTEPKEEKTAADTVHDDLLTHLGITEAPKGETKPAKKYTSKNIDTISEEGLNDTQKKVVKDVKNVVKAVSKLVEKTTGNPLEVNIHETPSSYEKAVIDAGGTKQDSTTKGFYLDADGTIHLNMERVTTDTMLHEGFHPVLDYMAKNRPDIIDNLHSQLEGLKGGKEVIDNANKLYEGSDATTIKKEAITDFIAKVADGTIKIDKTNFQKVKDFFVNAVNKLGFELGKDINTITDLKKLAELVSEKFNKGEEIEIKDGSKANSSERVQFQSDFKHQESGIEWKYFKNSKEFKKLVDDGYVTFDKNIDDFKGAVVLHAPDAGFSGQILKDGQLIADGKGGMYYPMVFHENGDFWAATSRGASKLAETLNEARKKSPDGKVRMVLISAPIDKLMSSSLNGIGLVDILTSKAFSEKSGITPEQLRKAIIKGIKTTEKLKNENKDGMKPSQKPLPKITGNETMADLHIKLKDFYPAENSDFPVRKSLNQNILEGIASYSSSPKVAKQLSEFLGAGTFNEKLKSTGGKLSRANLTQGFSNILAEPTLRGEQSGKMYAVIELGADVKPVKTSEHESYPYTLRSTDANEKPIIHILSQRDYWYNHVNDENGNSIADNKEKQASMLPASAGISSVVNLNPTKTEGVSPLAEKAKPQFSKEENENEDIVSASVNVAPLYSTRVDSPEQAALLQNSEFYKEFKNKNEKLAGYFNLKVDNQKDGIGGFAGVSEVTTVVNVTGKFEDIVKYAAINGSLTPEVQESTIAGMYVKKGSKYHNADKIEVGINDMKAAMRAVKDAGFDENGYTLLNDEISFFNIHEFKIDGFEEKINIFESKYKEYGGQITREDNHAVRSEYIDAERRKAIISKIDGEGLQREQDRTGLRNELENAKERNENFLNWKKINESDAAIEYRDLRQKQLELADKGESLSDKDDARIKELEGKLSEPLASIISSDKKQYEKAKKEIDTIANDVASLVAGGFKSEFGIKRPSRAAVKVVRWYDVQPNLLADGARANVIVNTNADADFLFNEIKRRFNSTLNRNEGETTNLGYPKRLIELRTKSGKIAEIQVMTPQGYLAKDGISHFPEDAKSKAKESLKEVRNKLGWDIPDGVGHYFYEIHRDPNVPKSLKIQAEELSNKYYKAFLDSESKLTDSEFRKDITSFKDKVDAANKSKWDNGNEGKSPKTLDKYLEQPILENKQQFSKEEVKPTETVESTTKALEEVAKNNPEKVADATSKVFEDAGFHRGTLSSKSDFINETYIGDLPFTGHYFVSNPKDVVQGGSRKGNEKAFRVVDFSKYNLLKFEDANSYFGTKRALKKMANDLSDVNSEEVVNDLLKNQNVSDRLKNKIKNFNANNDALDINAKIYKLEKLQESVKNNRDFNAINNEIDSLNEKLKSVKKVSFADNLKNILEEYKNKRKTEEFSERLETSILKSLGYEGVDVRGIKAEGGLKSPDGFSEGSVIFDLKPKTVSTPAEAYHDALKVPEQNRTIEQKEIILSVDKALGISTKQQFSKGDQDSKIKDFIEIQRQKGISDKDIQAGLEKASEKIGIDKAKIDELMSTPKVEQTGDLQSQYDGIKSEKAKKKFITKNFGEVSEEQLSDIVKNNTNLQTIKNKIDAIQKSGAGEVFQRKQEGNGSKGGKRGGMEQGEQGAEATTKKNGEENGDGQRVGISHKSLTELADKLGLEQPERGDVLTPEEYSERGKLLIKNGADPIKAAEEFKKDNKVNSDIISVARAHFNELVRDVNDARIKFGIDSEEYKKSLKEANDWAKNVVKPMGTAFYEIGSSLQGQVDLDTGNFVSVSMAVQEKTGKDLSTEQTKEVERLTTNVSDLNKKIQDLEKKLTDTISKGEEAKPKAKEGIKEKSKEIANIIRKGKLSKPDIFSSASPASLVWDAAIEITAKTVEVSGDIAQAIADGLEHIKNSDWYKNSDSDKQKAAQKAFRDFVQNQDIKIRFAEKKDNKFTTEEAKSIWEYAKEEYLDKGSDYREMLNGVSKDLGLNRDQVRTAISQPKGAKEITDEMYRNINKRNSAINEAKQWVEEQGNSKTKNFLKAVPSAFFKLKTFGHGTVGGITHAGTNIFQISKWKSYFPFFAKQFKYAFGDTAKYEMAMEDLKNDPQFTFWQRAGLAVDPKVKYDDYQGNFVDSDKKVNGIKKLFNRLGVTGDRGFNALKVYRLDIAKGFYDRLSNEEKADPNTAKEIAKLVNHSTGTSELDLGRGGVSKFVSTAFFAPKLEASRWQGLIGDPVKAAKTFTNWKESSPAEKAGAKLVARNAGEKIATYVALLAANSALLSLMGSKQKINYTNPLSSDWLKFKTGGGKTLDITGGTLASMKLLGTLLDNTVIGVTGTKKELWKKPAEKDYQAIGTQIRYKLSPFASTIADLVETTDAMGRPLPYSNIKPKKGETKYTYLSYVGQQQTPIPISAGIREAIGSMKERGMTNIQIQDVLMGTLYFTVEGFTGAKLGNEPKKKK